MMSGSEVEIIDSEVVLDTDKPELVTVSFKIPMDDFLSLERFRKAIPSTRTDVILNSIAKFTEGGEQKINAELSSKYVVALIKQCEKDTFPLGIFGVMFSLPLLVKKVEVRGLVGDVWSDKALSIVLERYSGETIRDIEHYTESVITDELDYFSSIIEVDSVKVRNLFWLLKEPLGKLIRNKK